MKVETISRFFWAALITLVVSGAAWAEPVIVPDVVGLFEPDANAVLTAVGLVAVETYDYSDSVAAGVVLSQDPVGGTAVPAGSSVDLVVSLGQPVVPDVRGMTEADANTAINSVDDLSIGDVTYEYSDTVAAGLVLTHSPTAGTVVPTGSSIDLVVSLGRPTVPDVVGMLVADANTAINAVDNLSIGDITYQPHDTVAAGCVLGQDPADGMTVPIGSSIDLVVSSGPGTTVTLVPILEGEPGSPTNPLSPSDEITIWVTSDGGLIGLDCILTIGSGPATIIGAIGDPCMLGTDPWPPDGVFPPIIDPDGKRAEMGAGTFGPAVSGIVGWFVLHCDGPGVVSVELTGGTSLGGSMDANFEVPSIEGAITIHQVSEPVATCWGANECAGQPSGDASCDGNVSLADLYALKANFGKSAPWTDNECCADFNQDGFVNLADLFVLRANHGTTGYSPSTGSQNCP